MTEETSGHTESELILQPKDRDVQDARDEEEEVCSEVVDLEGNDGSDEDSDGNDSSDKCCQLPLTV